MSQCFVNFEPETYAFMLAASDLIGFTTRRKKAGHFSERPPECWPDHWHRTD